MSNFYRPRAHSIPNYPPVRKSAFSSAKLISKTLSLLGLTLALVNAPYSLASLPAASLTSSLASTATVIEGSSLPSEDSARATPSASKTKTRTTAQTLLPYTATYTSSKAGMLAELQQTFSKGSGNAWQLHNTTSLLWFEFTESAWFTVTNNQVKPQRYQFTNSTNSKRNSDLVFNWEKSTALDRLHSKKPLKLPETAWDKLSVQAQIRLDILSQPDFRDQAYVQVDRTKLKTYNVSYLGEEQLHTELGTFDAVKLRERRDGRDKYTYIWLAKDWNYMILRLQRIEEGEVAYQIDIEEATISGKELRGS